MRVRVQALVEEDVEERTDETEAERDDGAHGDELCDSRSMAYGAEDVAKPRDGALRGPVPAAPHERGAATDLPHAAGGPARLTRASGPRPPRGGTRSTPRPPCPVTRTRMTSA